MLTRIGTVALCGLVVLALVGCGGQADVKTGKVKVTLQGAPFNAA